MGSRRDKRDKSDDGDKSKRKQYVMIGGIAGGAALVIVILIFVITSFRGPGNVVDTRSDADRNSAEKSAIQKLMDDDIAKATARGASREDIEKIRKSYQESLGKIGK
jgi:hypothetical protein